jgi:hypothetical protein
MLPMNASRVAVWMFGAAVVGAWLASAAGVPNPESVDRPAERAQAPNPADHLAADVEAQAGRMRQRLETAPAPQTPLRNPFSFSPREQPVPRRARVVPASVPIPATPPEPVEPSLELIGIAEKKAGDSVIRTAVISGSSGDVIMATAGQRILGMYEVAAVGSDAVELKNVATGAIRRLGLR